MTDRLALITHEYYPVLSGGTVFAEQISKELAKLGWEVDVLTTRIGGTYPPVEQADGFRVHRYRTARRSVSDSTLAEHLSYFGLGLPQMLARAAMRRYKAVFSVFAIPSGLITLAIQKVLGIPAIVFVDAADTPGVESAMKEHVGKLAQVFKVVVNQSAGVTILEGLEDLAMPYIDHDRVISVPNGTTLPDVRARPTENGPKLELLSIGRLVLRKGFQQIIEALGIVKRTRDDFQLRIVGYGRAENDIRKVLDEHRVSQCVSFLGRVEYKEIAQYYLSSDAYLFYGAREGSSLAMIEAAAHGLPIVASDHPGNRSYVEQGRSGFLVEHRNPQALAEAITSMLEHRSELPAMGRRSREIAEQYSWRSIAMRYDAFIRSTIGR